MELLLAAILCSLILPAIVLAFILPPGLAWGWMRIKSLVIVGKDYDVAEPTGEVELSQVCERPYVVDFNDPLVAETHEERTQRIKGRMNRPTPTLSGKGARPYVSLRTYKDRTEVEQNHELQIIKNH